MCPLLAWLTNIENKNGKEKKNLREMGEMLRKTMEEK